MLKHTTNTLYVLICHQEARLAQCVGNIETDAKNLFAHFARSGTEKSIAARTDNVAWYSSANITTSINFKHDYRCYHSPSKWSGHVET